MELLKQESAVVLILVQSLDFCFEWHGLQLWNVVLQDGGGEVEVPEIFVFDAVVLVSDAEHGLGSGVPE